MTMTTLSSQDFDQDISRARKAASEGPVLITEQGKPAYVLLSIEDYQRITGKSRNIADLLAMPGLADIEFDPLRSRELARPIDLS
jgi:prevent-host-death family protein